MAIQDLQVGYEGKTVLKGLNLTMRAGEQIVVTGDNGTGKSTLMKSLIGSVKPTNGEILLGGLPFDRVKKIPSPIRLCESEH